MRGKGRKERIVPIPRDLVKGLKALLNEPGVALHETHPLFVGTHKTRLTRFGATHIVRWDVATATTTILDLARNPLSPLVFRHSLAMTLLQSGMDFLTILVWLGHSPVATTHRYAAADVGMMRRGLEKAGVSAADATRFKPTDAVLRLLEGI